MAEYERMAGAGVATGARADVDAGLRAHMNKVYTYLAGGLGLAGGGPERALIERKTPEHDKRSSVLNATASGHALGQQAYAAMMEAESELKIVLSETDATQLKALLDSISDSLKP